jgi:hypothetical protein
MDTATLDWPLVDSAAAALGAGNEARRKWRQAGRRVPADWRIRIAEHLTAQGVAVALSDFDRLPTSTRRAA